MPTQKPDRTPLASVALVLGLMLITPLAQAQTNACQVDGETRRGILEASLNGTMIPRPNGNDLVVTIPEPWEENKWSLTRSSDPRDNAPTQYDVIDPSTNAIVVPANAAALVWLDIHPPPGKPQTSTEPTKVRLETDLPQSQYQPISLAAVASHYRRGGEKHFDVIFCIDNKQNRETHTWNFGLLIDDEWYDPQIRNDGSGPPPPPPTRFRKRRPRDRGMPGWQEK